MELRQLFTEDRAVSPVVGVALLIAITVILAAVIGGVVLGLGGSAATAPSAQLETGTENPDSGVNADGEEVTIVHSGGDVLASDNIVIRDNAGNTYTITEWDSGSGTYVATELGAGESAVVAQDGTDTDVNAGSGTEYAVVWQDPNSNDEAVLLEFTA